MSLFNKRFIFIYAATRSREFLTASGAVREGFKKVDKPWIDGWRVAIDSTVGITRKDPRDVRKRAVHLLTNRPVGTTVRIEALNKDKVVDRVRFRQALVKPPVKPTPGPIGLDRVEGFIESEYKNARWAGDCVCKPDSDHKDCAAVDYFDTEENMVRMKNDLLSAPDYFDIKYIILFDRLWKPDGSSQPHTGTFHAHVHVSVNGGVPNSAC